MTDEMRPLAISILAGEAVLGTATAEERAAVLERLSRDPDFEAEIAAWESRLAPLAEAVRPVDPPPGLWARIAARTVAEPSIADPGLAADPPAARDDGPVVDVAPSRIPTPDITPDRPISADPVLGEATAEPDAGIVVGLEEAVAVQTRYLRARVTRWRLATGAALALAAGLAGFAFLGPRFAPPVQDYVAVVNATGDLPPLIVRVDLQRGELGVEPLQMAPAAGKSHELWAVAGNAKPVSLGLVTRDRRSLARLGAEVLRDPSLTLAVSVEPEGGSPTGQPTGPVVYTGKLVALP